MINKVKTEWVWGINSLTRAEELATKYMSEGWELVSMTPSENGAYWSYFLCFVRSGCAS